MFNFNIIKIFSMIITFFIPSKIWRKRIRAIGEFGITYSLNLLKKENMDPPNFLSIAAIAKDEGEYFEEWIEYHRLVGVEKFYIYDNDSIDNTKNVLKPYIEEGIVEYIYFPGEQQQIPAYQDALSKSSGKTKWLAVIDLDEFFIPVETTTITEFLKKIPDDVSSLSVGWVMYGSSGHINKPKGLVLENYNYRTPNSLNVSKSIIKPARALSPVHPHWFNMIYGKYVDENGNKLRGYTEDIKDTILPRQKIRLNHYFTKSQEEYIKRFKRGNADTGSEFSTRSVKLSCIDNEATIFDDIAKKYVTKLKTILENKSYK